MKRIITVLLVAALMLSLGLCAFAEGETDVPAPEEIAQGNNGVDSKALSAAIVVGIVAAVGALGMALAISKSVDSMARQPEISDKINAAMMLGLVFIETAIIYALIVAILIIFVL